ncbi:MAG TPA: serine/threonine protein phosphatase [Bacteroidales bacterium]|nr:serine/threonine protein phosphatase [Bacteroidales bacterium]
MASSGASRRLQFSNFKLDTILDITRAINENLATKMLLDKYKRILKEQLKINKILLFNYSTKWEVMISSGFPESVIKTINIEKDFENIFEITTATSTKVESLQAFDVIIPVFHNTRPFAYVLIGSIDEEGEEGVSPTIKHLPFVQTITNIILVAIENKRLYSESLKQEALKKELELASKMQALLIPDTNLAPRDKDVFIDAYYLSHFVVGGDYYDFWELSDDEIGFCIADVSGKGISGAIIMSNLQANLRALFNLKTPLKEIVTRLNRIVMQNTNGDKFITMFIAKYNKATKQLNYVNAGHNPPIYYKLKSKITGMLTEGTTGLAMLDELPFINEGELIITEPTRLLCFTDGLAEIMNDNKEEIGLKAIFSGITKVDRIDKLISGLISELKISRDNPHVFDDVTMLGVEFF